MDSKQRVRIFIAILIVTIAVTAVVVVVLSHQPHRIEAPVLTPRTLYLIDISPQHVEGVYGVVNTTQGAAVHFNITLTSECKAQIAIPIEELRLGGYTEAITSTWGDIGWDKPLVQERVFDYSLSFDKVTLQPKKFNSTIITINLADGAPLGKYSIRVELGNIEFLSPPGKYDFSYSGDFHLHLIVSSSG